jgi:hypothetical protein
VGASFFCQIKIFFQHFCQINLHWCITLDATLLSINFSWQMSILTQTTIASSSSYKYWTISGYKLKTFLLGSNSIRHFFPSSSCWFQKQVQCHKKNSYGWLCSF